MKQGIIEATFEFEKWLGAHLPISRQDLRLKLAKARKVLAVGDLHIENFGTWRDLEGRLIWGVNDLGQATLEDWEDWRKGSKRLTK